MASTEWAECYKHARN